MPQLFQVLKCYKCSVFQVLQTKKSNKWECKLCGEKQSIKRHYGIGTGKECRLHVQRLNGIRGEIEELTDSIELNKNSDDEPETRTSNASEKKKISNVSKWSNFIEESELSQKPEINKSMYLGNCKVVLDIPVRKRKKFNPPTSAVEIDIRPEYEPNKSIPRLKNMSKPEVSVCNYNKFFKEKSFQVQTTVLNTEIPVKDDHYLAPTPKIYGLTDVPNNEVTQALNCQNENHNTYVPTKVNKNSKWAEFADEPNEIAVTISRDNSFSLDVMAENVLPIKECTSENVAKSLFTLCDESELDDVLQF